MPLASRSRNKKIMNKTKQGARALSQVITLTLILLLGACAAPPEKVVDIDGNNYTAVHAGSMVWTSRNLNVAHFRNGDPIPEVQDPAAWATLATPAWCYNENKPENGKLYGKLYNWYAVNDPRGLAPEGWHVATDEEWSALGDLLGGETDAGGALKALEHWNNQTDKTQTAIGFDALPAGARRDTDGNFMPPGEYSRLWTATEASEKSAWSRSLGYFDAALRKGKASKNTGFSVRCVKN